MVFWKKKINQRFSCFPKNSFFSKRGQFYLIAAIIIVAVLLTLAGVTNYVVTRDDDRKQNLEDELKLESEQVVNFGVFNERELDNLLEEFATKYSGYIDDEFEFLFIYGDEDLIDLNEVNFLSSRNIEGSFSLELSNRFKTSVETRSLEFGTVDISQGGEYTFNFGNANYDIKINEGQNFFFVIQQPYRGENE